MYFHYIYFFHVLFYLLSHLEGVGGGLGLKNMFTMTYSNTRLEYEKSNKQKAK